MAGDQKLVEAALLSHLISDIGLFEAVDALKLRETDFTCQDLGKLFNALKSILPCSSDETLIRLNNEHNGAILDLALSLLTDRLRFDFDACLRFLVEASKKRDLINNLTEAYGRIASTHDKLSNEDILQIIEEVKNKGDCATNLNETFSYNEVANEFVDDFEKRVVAYRDGIMPGITTGLPLLDEMIYGWIPGSYTIVGARTSMGKTTLALNFADAAAKSGKGVLFFSNEVKNRNLVAKHLSKLAKVKGPDIHRGSVSDSDIDRISFALKQTQNYPIYFNQKFGRNLELFKSEVQRMKRKKLIDMVILDYIQQMYCSSSKDNRLAELTYISNSMKELACGLDIPIICLAQLNRSAEQSNEAPNISQIRDCGAIEQDADNILIIHRNKDEEPNSNGEVSGQIVIGKSRDGKTGSCPVMINFAHNNFR